MNDVTNVSIPLLDGYLQTLSIDAFTDAWKEWADCIDEEYWKACPTLKIIHSEYQSKHGYLPYGDEGLRIIGIRLSVLTAKNSLCDGPYSVTVSKAVKDSRALAALGQLAQEFATGTDEATESLIAYYEGFRTPLQIEEQLMEARSVRERME